MTNKTDYIRKFYHGVWYPFLVAALVFAGHATGLDVAFVCAVLLSALPGLFVMHDAEFLIAPFMMTAFTVSARQFDPSATDYHYERFLEKPWSVLFFCAVGVVIAALAYFMVRNRRGANRLNRRSPIFLSLVVLCGVMLFNGVFNPIYTPKNLLFVVIFAASTLFVYLFFALYGNFDRRSIDRFFFCLVITGVLVLAELVFAFFTRVRFEDGGIVKESVVVGWGVWTSIGGMLAFLLPAPFYFARWHRNGWVFFLIGLALFAGAFSSQSRGALLVGGAVLLVSLVLVCAGGSNRKQNRLFTTFVAVALAVGALLMSRRMGTFVRNFAEYGLNDNGRFALWKAGWKHFLEYPVFGSGFYDSAHGDWNFVFYPYFYHNTLVQMLASCGAVGLLAYLWHRAMTVRLVFTRRNVEKAFLGACILGLLLFGLVDVQFFKTYPTVLYAQMLVYMEMSERKAE